jgi:hypothetical protein
MHATPAGPRIAPARTPTTRPYPGLIELTEPHATPAADQVAQAAAELRRWALFLGIPSLLSAAFFMVAIGTGQLWPIGGSLVTGPGLLIAVVIYLGLSSDTNGVQ